MNKFIQISVTYPDREEAERTAGMLVSEKLCSCVQIIGPIKSIYRWKGDIKNAEEWLCLIKSTGELFNDIKVFIKENHSYEVPEIVSYSITNGSGDYLEWIENEVKKK